MLNTIFNLSLSDMNAASYLWCTLASLVCGGVVAGVHSFRNTYSKNFLLTLIILPAIVQVVIMMVNGNVGTGVAVMGAFSLVRFRSVPGNSREIASIFLAMAAGLATGMGYIGIALLLVLLIGAAILLFTILPFGEERKCEKTLKILIPENTEYEGLFEDLFEQYTFSHKLIKVKTVSMGSLYELQYKIQWNGQKKEKEFLDAIRCRNGNLTVSCGFEAVDGDKL